MQLLLICNSSVYYIQAYSVIYYSVYPSCSTGNVFTINISKFGVVNLFPDIVHSVQETEKL